MKVTGREAGRMLGALGVDRESARRALLAGVAGPAVRIGGLVLYELARMEDLVARVAPRSEEARRVGCGKGADMTAPMAEQLDAVRMWWQLSAFTRLLLRLRIEQDGFFPFLAAVSGFAVVGADMVGLEPSRPEGSAFLLREASAWFEPLRGQRLPVTSGGPWQLWSPEIAALRSLPSAWLTTIEP